MLEKEMLRTQHLDCSFPPFLFFFSLGLPRPHHKKEENKGNLLGEEQSYKKRKEKEKCKTDPKAVLAHPSFGTVSLT